MSIKIRPYSVEDLHDWAQVHFDAVHALPSGLYSEQITNIWAPEISIARLDKIQKNGVDEKRIIAEKNGTIVGFGALAVKTNELRACYVHPKHWKKGIGKQIISALEKIAVDEGLSYLETYASLYAYPFYERCGYKTIENTIVSLGTDHEIACVKMKKDLKISER